MKRPNNIPILLGSGFLGLFLGLILSGAVSEDARTLRLILGLTGLCTPPIACLAWSEITWQKYLTKVAQDYEAAKAALRKSPDSIAAREAMVQTGRIYYGSLRENGLPTIYDEQAINNDLTAIIGR